MKTNYFRRITAALLAAGMISATPAIDSIVGGIVSIGAAAYSYGNVNVGGVKYLTNSNGSAYVAGYAGPETDINISSEITDSEGEKYTVTYIGDDVFKDNTEITSVKISSGIESIGESAFEGCINLESVDLGNVQQISISAFEGCTSLTEIEFPKKSADNNCYIDNYAFKDCTGLKSAVLSDILIHENDSGDIFMYVNGIFVGCTDLENYYLDDDIDSLIEIDGVIYTADGKTIKAFPVGRTEFEIPEGVTTIGGFNYSNITTVTIPGSVKTVEGFFGCKKLRTVIINEGVVKIGFSAFSGCTALESIDLPNSITEIGSDAFKCCIALESVDLPDSIINIGSDAFSGCFAFESIDIPQNTQTIGANAFSGCHKIKSLYIPASVKVIGGNPVASISGAYCNGQYFDYDDMQIKEINVSPDNKYYKSIDGVLYNYDLTEIIAYPAAKTGGSIELPSGVNKIWNSAFLNCDKLESIIFSENVTDIGFSAFEECDNLKDISFFTDEKVVPEHIKSISLDAFNYCKSITTLSIPSCVTNIFADCIIGCSSLTSVTIPESVSILRYSYDCKPDDSVPPFYGSQLSTVYGYKDSFAEELADKDGYDFVSIGEATNIPIILECTPQCEIYYKPETTKAVWVFIGRIPKAESYNIYRSESPDGEKTLIKSLDQITYENRLYDNDNIDYYWYYINRSINWLREGRDVWGLGYRDTDIKPYKTYYYFATSVDEDGNESGFSDYAMVSTGEEEPAPDPEPDETAISGTLSSYDRSMGSLTVKLTDKNGKTQTKFSSDGTYSFNDLDEDETYTLSFSLPRHVQRTYRNVAAGSELDPSLNLYGDINGDGSVDAKDATQILRYDAGMNGLIRKPDKSEDDYLKAVGNITGTGAPTARDATQILRYDAGIPSRLSKLL